FAIPAVNAQELISALGEELTTKVTDRWGFYSDTENLPTATRESSVLCVMGEQAKSSFDAADLSVYINAAHLTDVYNEQIELIQDKTLDLLNNLRFMPQQTGMDIQAIIDLYGTLAEGIFQSLEDAVTVTLAVNLNDREIAIDKLVDFESGSKTSEFLGRQERSEMALLEKLPSGAAMYFGFSGDVKRLMKFGFKLS